MKQFLAKPTETGIKTLWLGISSVLIGPITGLLMGVFRYLFDRVSFNGSFLSVGMLSVVLSLFLSVLTIRSFLKAYKQKDRSILLWVGLILAISIATFWIIMIAGELIFPH